MLSVTYGSGLSQYVRHLEVRSSNNSSKFFFSGSGCLQEIPKTKKQKNTIPNFKYCTAAGRSSPLRSAGRQNTFRCETPGFGGHSWLTSIFLRIAHEKPLASLGGAGKKIKERHAEPSFLHHYCAPAATGSHAQNSVRPGPEFTSSRPPCCRIMRCAISNPMPDPSPSGLVV